MEVTVIDIDAAHYFTNVAAGSLETSAADLPVIPRSVPRSTRLLNVVLHRDPEFYGALSLPDSVSWSWTPA